jgi:N-acyl homoserine lactone hydrolase
VRADMRLYALHCGGDMSDMAGFDPFDENVGTKVYNPYFLYVMTHPRGAVLFDSGVHPSAATDPESRLGPDAAAFRLELGADDHLEACLRRIGMKPSDIKIVVQSHLHFDHAGGLDCVRHAEVLVQRRELAFALDPPVYQRDVYVRADYDLDLRWHELDGDHDVFGDGRLMTVSTPGHTPGHQSLMVALEGQVVILLADATYLLDKMRARRLPAIVWNPDSMVASWERLEQLEREHDARLMPTHDLQFQEHVKLAPDGWYE